MAGNAFKRVQAHEKGCKYLHSTVNRPAMLMFIYGGGGC
jgi:hypothetical protein